MGNAIGVMHDSTDRERSATDDRIDENREPAPIAPVTRDAAQSEPSGLPPGHTDDDRSPLDPAFFDPAQRERSSTSSPPQPAGAAGDGIR